MDSTVQLTNPGRHGGARVVAIAVVAGVAGLMAYVRSRTRQGLTPIGRARVTPLLRQPTRPALVPLREAPSRQLDSPAEAAVKLGLVEAPVKLGPAEAPAAKLGLSEAPVKLGPAERPIELSPVEAPAELPLVPLVPPLTSLDSWGADEAADESPRGRFRVVRWVALIAAVLCVAGLAVTQLHG